VSVSGKTRHVGFIRQLLVVLLAMVALESCGGESSNVVTVKFWALGNEGENVQKFIPEFEKENPGIVVDIQQIPWTAAHEKLLTAFAGNSLPDICQLGNTWIPEFSFLGAIDSLNDLIARSSEIASSNYFPGIWEPNVMGTAVYGIPWYVDTRLLFYRKDILAKAGFPEGPKSWADLQTASARIVGASGHKRYAIFLPTNEWQPLVLFALEAGATLLRDNDTRGDFTNASFEKAYAFYRSCYTKGYSPLSWMEIQNIYQGIAEGYIAMYITGPWNVGEFKRRLPPDLQDKWMTAPMPAVDGSFPGCSFAGGSSFVIVRSSPRKVAAWKLIEYLSRTSVQLRFYHLTGDLPTVRKAWEDSTLSKDPYMRAFFLQLQNLKMTPKVPEWEQIAAQIMSSAETGVSKNVPDSSILKSLNESVDQILEKRRWLIEHRILGQ
jgi:multiple sugar transport system substrate-binding protein